MIVDHLAVEASRRAVYRLLATNDQWEVHLVVPPTWNENGRMIECEPERSDLLHLHVSPVFFGHRAHRVVYRQLPSLLHRFKPDFLLMEAEPENFAALQAVGLRQLMSKHTVLGLVSWRNIDHARIGFPYKLSFLNVVCDRVVRRFPVDALFCKTKASMVFAQPYASSTHYLPPGVDCSLFTCSPEERVVSDSVTIGFAGRIAEAKGVRILVEAFAGLRGSHRLVLVGGGDMEGSIQAEAERLGVAGRIVLHPPVRHSEMARIIQGFDILVLPSLETRYWKEQFGRILIEAMACCVPVVASDSGGIPDVVEGAGVLVRTGNVQSLKESLMSLIENPTRRKALGPLGRQHVLKHFDAPVVAAMLARDILNTHRTR